jgi:MSHA biogenesis protein MshJ
MEQLKKISEKIDSLSLRERAIVFIGVIAVIFTLWDALLMAPLQIEQKKIIASLNNKNADRMILVTQIQSSIKQSKVDPNADNLKKLKSLRSKLINVQAELESSTEHLVSPRDMPKVLETVLHKTGGLTLNNLRSLGVTPLVANEETKDTEKVINENIDESETKLSADNIENAYRHGLRIEFQGDYLTTLEYLKQLEELEWGFFWDNFELNVSEYPVSSASVEIFTLSLNEVWIGV